MRAIRDYLTRSFELAAYRDRDTLVTGLTFALVAAILLAFDRFGLQNAFYDHVAKLSYFDGVSTDRLALYSQIHFSLSAFVLFVCVPTLFHFIFPVRENGVFGLGVRSLPPHLPIYAALPAVMIPVVWFVSQGPAFYEFYPMYNPESLRFWLLFEAVYFLQFFAVEFFFRGLLLFRLERRFGLLAVWIMVVPYALIHIHKPFPEALGSIVAGVVLGTLSIKSRSIWAGVAVHCAVAFAADFFALLHSGRLDYLAW